MQAESKKVISVIVTFNGGKWIEKCLSSLIHSTLPTSVIVIDNGSSDNTVEIIKNKYKEVKLILSEENLGFGKANNIGLRMALEENADYVFLLNQDAWVESNTLEHLAKVAECNPEYGLISPIHLNGEGDKLDLYFSRYASPDKCPGFYSDAVVKQRYKDIYPIEFVNAAAWLLPLKTLETVGGFDPIFSHYGEDNNYIQRVHFHGLRVGICPTARVFHDREERINSRIVNSSSAEIKKRHIFIEFGDVSKKCPYEIRKRIQQIKKKLFPAIIFLKIKTFHELWQELALLKRVKPFIEKSWEENRKKSRTHI